MTLYEAITEILVSKGGQARVLLITAEVARRDLYRMGNGGHPSRRQVDARISKGMKRGLFRRVSPGVVALGKRHGQ